MSAGKYDSDLDFKINRKIKRVFLPLPKRTKIILSAVAGVVFIGLFGSLGIGGGMIGLAVIHLCLAGQRVAQVCGFVGGVVIEVSC